MAEIKDLIGKTLVGIHRDEFEMFFVCTDSTLYKMHHVQDCCESVTIDDVCGDLDDLIGSPILIAEENTQLSEGMDESYTWTFYKLATCKGYVDIKWYGTSNGYYSESVDFTEVKSKH